VVDLQSRRLHVGDETIRFAQNVSLSGRGKRGFNLCLRIGRFLRLVPLRARG
jgi:hypothetical protein